MSSSNEIHSRQHLQPSQGSVPANSIYVLSISTPIMECRAFVYSGGRYCFPLFVIHSICLCLVKNSSDLQFNAIYSRQAMLRTLIIRSMWHVPENITFLSPGNLYT